MNSLLSLRRGMDMHKKILDIRKTFKIITKRSIDLYNTTGSVFYETDVYWDAEPKACCLKYCDETVKAIISELNKSDPREKGDEKRVSEERIEIPIFEEVKLLNDEELHDQIKWDTWINVRDLANILFTIFIKEDLLSLCKITPADFIQFLNAVSYSYNKNPYHNIYHGLDVAIRGYFMYKRVEGRYLRNNVIVISLILGSLLHDVGHLGFRSSFLVKHSKTLLNLFGEKSLNERMHCHIARVILEHHEYSIIRNLKITDQVKIQNNIEAMILGTNLEDHAYYIDKFLSQPDRIGDIIIKGPVRKMSQIELVILLKIADLSNTTLDAPYFHKVSSLVSEEENSEKYFAPETCVMPTTCEAEKYLLSFLEIYIVDFYCLIKDRLEELGFLYDNVVKNYQVLKDKVEIKESLGDIKM